MKIDCNVCNKYKKSKKTKILYTFQETLDLSMVYSRCDHKYKKIFIEEKSIKILKILGLFTDTEEYHKIYNHV